VRLTLVERLSAGDVIIGMEDWMPHTMGKMSDAWTPGDAVGWVDEFVELQPVPKESWIGRRLWTVKSIKTVTVGHKLEVSWVEPGFANTIWEPHFQITTLFSLDDVLT